MNKYITSVLVAIILTMSIGTYFLYSFNSALIEKVSEKVPEKQALGGAVTGFYPTNAVASSSKYTVTTTSAVLLATTSSTTRIASLFQVSTCSVGGGTGVVYLNARAGNDATANTGPVLIASSSPTVAFNTFSNPIGGQSIQAKTFSGTCDVTVTEWVNTR